MSKLGISKLGISALQQSGEPVLGSRFTSLPGMALWAGIAFWIALALLAMFWGMAVAAAEMNALVIGISLLACIFILLDFRVGVALLILLMPISSSAMFPRSIAGITGLNPLNLLLIATLVSCLLHAASVGSLMRLPSWRLWLLYVVPMIFAGVLGSRSVGDIPSYFYTWDMVAFTNASGYIRDMLLKPLFMVLFALLVGETVARTKKLEFFLVPFVFSVWAMCLLTLVFVYLSGASLGEMSSNTARSFLAPLGIHANDLGRLYAIAYALMLFTMASTTDYRLKFFLIVSMGVVVLALMLTFSRGAFLGFIVVNVLFLVSRRKIKTLLLGILLMVPLVFVLPGAVYERIASGWGGGLNAISAGRVDDIWLPLLQEVWRSPIYGNGLGSILWSDAIRSDTILQVTHPHNAYLQALLDMGILGLLLLCAYFIHVWKGFRILSKHPQLSPAERGFYEGAAAGLVSFMIAAFVGSSLLPVAEQTFLWLAIGMMYGHCRMLRSWK